MSPRDGGASALERTRDGAASLTLRGTGDDHARPGVAFFSHLDVVPVNKTGWTGGPFELRQRNRWLVGRGATENKGDRRGRERRRPARRRARQRAHDPVAQRP